MATTRNRPDPLRRALRNLIASNPELAAQVPEDVRRSIEMSLDELSPREADAFWVMCEDLPMKEAAARIGMSAKTLDCHRASIMRKLGLETRVGLLRWAIRRGLVQP